MANGVSARSMKITLSSYIALHGSRQKPQIIPVPALLTLADTSSGLPAIHSDRSISSQALEVNPMMTRDGLTPTFSSARPYPCGT
jgi:hypothetical protein